MGSLLSHILEPDNTDAQYASIRRKYSAFHGVTDTSWCVLNFSNVVLICMASECVGVRRQASSKLRQRTHDV